MKMKMLIASVVFTFFCISGASAQETKDSVAVSTDSQNVINHKVEAGETVMLICKKYLVRPQDIYAVNPGAVNGISTNMTLKIPADKSLMSRNQLDKRTKHVAHGSIKN